MVKIIQKIISNAWYGKTRHKKCKLKYILDVVLRLYKYQKQRTSVLS